LANGAGAWDLAPDFAVIHNPPRVGDAAGYFGGNEIVRTARGPARGLTQRNWNVSPGERCIEGRVICRLDYSLILFRRLNQKASEIQVRPATQRRGGLGPQIITCGREFQFPVWS